MSPRGDALTAVNLKMQVVGKGTLRLKLPEGSPLFNVLVNDEGATLVREGDEWLFYVFPSPEVGRPTAVRFVYSAGTRQGQTARRSDAQRADGKSNLARAGAAKAGR